MDTDIVPRTRRAQQRRARHGWSWLQLAARHPERGHERTIRRQAPDWPVRKRKRQGRRRKGTE